MLSSVAVSPAQWHSDSDTPLLGVLSQDLAVRYRSVCKLSHLTACLHTRELVGQWWVSGCSHFPRGQQCALHERLGALFLAGVSLSRAAAEVVLCLALLCSAPLQRLSLAVGWCCQSPLLHSQPSEASLPWGSYITVLGGCCFASDPACTSWKWYLLKHGTHVV